MTTEGKPTIHWLKVPDISKRLGEEHGVYLQTKTLRYNLRKMPLKTVKLGSVVLYPYEHVVAAIFQESR